MGVLMRLVLRFDGQDVQEFVLDKNDITIGRTANNDIVIDNMAVSTHHATVHLKIGGAVLIDMDSTNGTFVNDQKINRHILQDGDSIGIGKHQIIFFTTSAFTTSGYVSDDQNEATVMMSSDFQQQLQRELSKNKTAASTVRRHKKQGLIEKIKNLLGL